MKKKSGSQLVAPSLKGWSVRSSNSARATALFKNKTEAIILAAELARKQKTTLYIFGDDGRIEKRFPYVDDFSVPVKMAG